MKKKGSVLIQVLVTAMIVAVIAAGIIQVVLMRGTIQARTEQGAGARQQAEGTLNTIMTAWNLANNTCVDAPGLVRTGGPGGCSCSYTAANGTTACAGTGCNPPLGTNPCAVSITAPLPQ